MVSVSKPVSRRCTQAAGSPAERPQRVVVAQKTAMKAELQRRGRVPAAGRRPARRRRCRRPLPSLPGPRAAQLIRRLKTPSKT